MGSRCDICVDPNCKKKQCNCDTCKNVAKCNKFLYPTIRITDKCTQSCEHCCYSCSPDSNAMMSIDVAQQIKQFLTNNSIKACTLMGGEFFMHPQWKTIFDIIIPKMLYVRLVTNGDWATNEDIIQQLQHYSNLKLAISKDRWHTNRYVKEASELCEKYNIQYKVATQEETKESSIVPVGRQMYGSFYSMFAAYCFNPEHHYNFLIDEQGDIFKCGFGIWKYTNIHEHLDGGFNARFKEFNLKFYDYFISNCSACIRAYESAKPL